MQDLKAGDLILMFMTFVMMSIVWVAIGLHWAYPVGIFIACYILNGIHNAIDEKILKKRMKNW